MTKHFSILIAIFAVVLGLGTMDVALATPFPTSTPVSTLTPTPTPYTTCGRTTLSMPPGVTINFIVATFGDCNNVITFNWAENLGEFSLLLRGDSMDPFSYRLTGPNGLLIYEWAAQNSNGAYEYRSPTVSLPTGAYVLQLRGQHRYHFMTNGWISSILPTSTPTMTPTATATPTLPPTCYIHVSSPTEGQQACIGQTITLTWEQTGVARVDISCTNKRTGVTTRIATNYPNVPPSYELTVGPNLGLPGDELQLNVASSIYTVCDGNSGNFTISNCTPTPTATNTPTATSTPTFTPSPTSQPTPQSGPCDRTFTGYYILNDAYGEPSANIPWTEYIDPIGHRFAEFAITVNSCVFTTGCTFATAVSDGLADIATLPFSPANSPDARAVALTFTEIPGQNLVTIRVHFGNTLNDQAIMAPGHYLILRVVRPAAGNVEVR